MIGMAVVTMGILGWLVYRQRDIFINFQWQFRPLPIILSFFLYSLCLGQVAAIWVQIMNSLAAKVDFFKHFRFFCISLLGKRLPGTVWYIPWRAKMYEDLGISFRQVSLASGIELLISVIAGIFASLTFALPILKKYQIGIWVSILFIVFSAVLIHPQVIRRIGILLKLDLGQVQYKKIIYWIAQYFIFWLVSGALVFCVINIFYPLSVENLGYVIGAWSLTFVLSTSIFLLPSNFGFTEISLSLMLSVIMPSPVAVIAATGMRILLLFYELLWAGSMMLVETFKKAH